MLKPWSADAKECRVSRFLKYYTVDAFYILNSLELGGMEYKATLQIFHRFYFFVEGNNNSNFSKKKKKMQWQYRV